MSTCLDELGVIHERYNKLKADFLKNDGKIDADEQRRLDAVSADWTKARDACLAKAQSKIDKTAADAGARLKVDPAELKTFKDNVKKLSAGAQEAASDVLNILLTFPPPADAKASKDLREKIRQSFSKLGDGEKMAVGKELNKLGIYIPNLKEDSPGAEDATARIKDLHVSGDLFFDDGAGNIVTDGVQVDYIKGLVLQAQKQGFKVIVQMKRGVKPVADIIDLFARETGIAKADLPKFMEVLEADSADYIWSEDNKWLSVDGSTIHASPDISTATSKYARAFTNPKASQPGDVREGHHSAGQDATDKPDEARPGGMISEGAFQGQVDKYEYGQPWWDPKYRHLSADALGKATGKTVTKNRTYNEGGNMLVGTKPDGQPYAMIGRDGVLLSMFHIQEEFANETDPSKKKAHEFSPDKVKARRDSMTFDPDELAATKKRLEYIYSNPETLAPLPAGASDEAKRAYALYKADFEKSKKQFDQEKAEFNKDKDEFTKSFLAKLDITKDIFAKDTKIPRKDLIFVPQPDFHVDMHMRPVAPGQVMVNDFAEDIKLIDEALKLAAKPSWEEKQLLSMKANALRSQKAMEPVIKEIEKQLKDAGLEVVPAPGVMEADMEPFEADPGARAGSISKKVATDLALPAKKSYTRKELGQAYKAKFAGASKPPDINRLLDDIFTRHANFMNAVPGTKEGTNEQFYMTNATSIKPLQEAYKAYLKGKGVENVEWIGGTGGGGEFDRTASEESLQASGGLDCRENH